MMTGWLLAAIEAFVIVLLVWDAKWKDKEEPRPRIDVQSPCPACGNLGCTLGFVAMNPQHPAKILRTCTTCGCEVTQHPIYPELFKKT